MPELPEVEMIVRDLRSKIVGRRILGVQTDWPKYFRLPSSEAGFRACITGKVITAVDRRSKNVLISLTGDYLLLIHQKISGRLLVGNWERKSESQAGSTPHSLWQAVSPPRGSTVPQGRFIHLCFAIIPSACNRLTWNRMKTDDRDTCQSSFCPSFDSFDS
jgi:hypothetical protein